MNTRKFRAIALFAALILLGTACASTQRKGTPQADPWHYKYSVLLTPDQPIGSPQLDLAMSLLEIHFPGEQTEYINNLLYSASGPDEYKDKLIEQEREDYRKRLLAAMSSPEGLWTESNWRYSETINIKSEQLMYYQTKGIVIEREYETWSGGAHPAKYKDHYVLDLEECKRVQIEDLFTDYRGEAMRKIIYAGLRKYDKLREGQPLSDGIFFRDEPELTYNFFIAEEGLGLYWNPAEIAPYVAGSIEIVLPWRAIRPFLQCNGIALLSKFDIYLLVI